MNEKEYLKLESKWFEKKPEPEVEEKEFNYVPVKRKHPSFLDWRASKSKKELK